MNGNGFRRFNDNHIDNEHKTVYNESVTNFTF